MMSMSGYMIHANVEGLSWTMTWGGFVVGLLAWTICAAAVGWLIGWIYNYLGDTGGS